MYSPLLDTNSVMQLTSTVNYRNGLLAHWSNDAAVNGQSEARAVCRRPDGG
jgi:hypothetical protein